MVNVSTFFSFAWVLNLNMALTYVVPESPYILRYLAFALATKAKQSVFDYKFFPKKTYSGCGEEYLIRQIEEQVGDVGVRYKGEEKKLKKLLAESDTQSFIVLKDGKIVYDFFSGGCGYSTPMLTYSVTKSLFASYLSILADNGVIKLDEKLMSYHSRLPKFVGERTIRSLMNMESGIRYSQGKSPFTDMVKFWFSPNIRHQLKNIHPQGNEERLFLYNDIHLHLLSRVVDSRISDVAVDFCHNFWSLLKPAYNAYFCLDSSRTSNMKVDGGFVATPYDLAQFGLLYADNGMLHGNQILNEDWCKELKSDKGARTDIEYWKHYREMNHRWFPVLSEQRTYYKNLWWGLRQEGESPNDIYAMGILGQFVYISTKHNVVIVRQGNSWGIEGWWPYIFEELAGKL